MIQSPFSAPPPQSTRPQHASQSRRCVLTALDYFSLTILCTRSPAAVVRRSAIARRVMIASSAPCRSCAASSISVSTLSRVIYTLRIRRALISASSLASMSTWWMCR